MDIALLAVGAWLLLGGRGRAETAARSSVPATARPPTVVAPGRRPPTLSPTLSPPAKKSLAAVDDALVRRANQPRARAWSQAFQQLGVPQSQADAYARWAGIESSGNPLAISPIGERGLFQITSTTARNTISPQDWEAMIRPTTARAEHARMALAQARIYEGRAKRMTRNFAADPISQIWYAKAWHARPGDFRSREMHGDAREMSRALEAKYQGDARALRRLHAANVVAFGTTRVGPHNG